VKVVNLSRIWGVGELMINRVGAFPRCIGFAAFLKDRNPHIDHWLDLLREDVKKMADNVQPFENRLINIQNALIDLLDFLDPNGVYFSEDKRRKI